MLGVVLLVQQIEGHVLQPLLMGHAVSLHPVAVLLAVAAGSFVAGIVGALFAVPIVAVLNTVVLYLHGHDKFPQLGADDHVPVRGRGHPVLDRAIAQVAEATSERRQAEVADGRTSTGRRQRRPAGRRRPSGAASGARDDRPRGRPGGRRRCSRASPTARPVRAQPRAVRRSSGADVWLKCENLQRAGSFKIRGAYVRMARLTRARSRRAGVVAASAGNHAQGVALAARMLGIDAVVFMPVDAALPKVAATREYGAQVELVGRQRRRGARRRAASTRTAPGAVLIHPFDHADVVAGQGTVGLEILEQVPDVRDRSSCRSAAAGSPPGSSRRSRELRPDVRVVGVQAARAAAYPASLAAGHPVPAPRAAHDGRRHRGRHARRACRSSVLRRTRHRRCGPSPRRTCPARCCSSPSGPSCSSSRPGRRRSPRSWPARATFEGPVVAILSGGNIDPLVLLRVVRHGLASAGRFLQLRVRIDDRPGALAALLARPRRDRRRTSCTSSHVRTGGDLALDEVEIEVQVETKGPDHCAQVVAAAAGAPATGSRGADAAAPDDDEAPTPRRGRRLGRRSDAVSPRRASPS